MGTFYRSQHELVFAFKNGTAPHINNFELGQHRPLPHQRLGLCRGEHLKAGRMEELAMHPTVKPVAMVADAIKDCSKRGEIVLDAFGGSGTTLMPPSRPKRGTAGRDRSALRRRDDPALAGPDRQEGDARRHRRDLRVGRPAARHEPTGRR